jgi:hypothetical protein
MRPILWLATLISANTAPGHTLTTWTSPAPAVHIAGRGDVVLAATPGGLVTWERPVGPVRVHTTEHGVPSNDVRAACFDAGSGHIVVATANGLGRGWTLGGWETLLAQPDGSGSCFDVCTPLDRGGVIAGGMAGLLVSWNGGQVDSLRVPCRSRVVGIATLLVRTTDTEVAFPPGLVVATEHDGVWLLRRVAPVQWLQLTERDGLPSNATLGVVEDALGCVWAATRAGLARIDAAGRVTAWPLDPWLSQRAVSLYHAPNRRVYFGFWNGLASFDPGDTAMRVEPAPGVHGAIAGVGWSDEGLWWTDGHVLRSFLGVELRLPQALAAPQAACLFMNGDDVWVGHRFGAASVANRAAPQWEHVETEPKASDAAITSFCAVDGDVYAGSASGLYVGSRLGTELRFLPVESAPVGEVRAQVVWQGRHWIGGSMGLWERRGSAWWPVHLWSGASEIHSMTATAETLWAAAGEGGLAFHDGTAWTVPNGTCSTAFAGPLALGPGSGVLVGTRSGVATVNGTMQRPVPGSAGLNAQAICAWGGDVVVGTRSGLWIQSAGTWRRLGVTHGLPSADVLSLTVDAAGGLWVGTVNGVCILPPAGTTSSDHVTGPAELHDAARVDVFDVRGRRIRTWLAPPSWNTRDWDGTDATGRRVASGVYFAQAQRLSGPATTHRIVVVR